MTDAERQRLEQSRNPESPWKFWGPYLSERQWGTVREDYSADGNAWNYFTHDQARSRAYRWGEDGLAGVSDEKQRLCFALALWNGKDPILKERLFGLTNSEGNHGEDVKEYYFYLDSTPTHSYMRYLYKYPHRAYPYNDLVATNRSRNRHQFEYELIETGVFAGNRYFDVFVEYAKAGPLDLLIRIRVVNRGPEAAPLHLLPTLWFRNTWSWDRAAVKPVLRRAAGEAMDLSVEALHPELGRYFLIAAGAHEALFTENETNRERIHRAPNPSPFVKDAFHEYLIRGARDRVNRQQIGTKCGLHYPIQAPGGGEVTLRLRLVNDQLAERMTIDVAAFDEIFSKRSAESDEFHESIMPDQFTADEANVFRQAMAGMQWTKQYYYYDVERWLRERNFDPLTPARGTRPRNASWHHMVNGDIISMPDKWEYPWYAAWDLAFHTLALGMTDLAFAKHQLDLMLRDNYLHPNGQIPAYEWNFSDVNPPVHAWAVLQIYNMERSQRGVGDLDFLLRSFQKLVVNFTWWVNRKDPGGRNVFEGGFLGLDNIGVFDRSAPLPMGGTLEQADGTAWMAFYAQNLFEMAMELSMADPAHDDMAYKFVEHFLWIAAAMDRAGVHQDELWDEEEGFFYDLIRLPDGNGARLKVRSMVGLLPLCATSVISGAFWDRHPDLSRRIDDLLARRPHLAANLHPPADRGVSGRHLLAILNESKLRRILSRMLDETKFLSPHGIRSLSKWHEKNPYVLRYGGKEYTVRYQPAESDSGMFGGNSNWRGPVWMPVNLLLIRALLKFYMYYGDTFLIECPTGSGRRMTLFEVAKELGGRLAKIFLRDSRGRRPVYGATELFQSDPHWKDLILFFEYFHGDNGAGLGASHQTGWTGIVARAMQFFGYTHSHELLADAPVAPFMKHLRD